MKCLVTGGTGFTGKALCLRLLQEGWAVVSLDYKEGLKTDELRRAGAEVIIGSVTDRAVVERAMAGVDTVYHLAAAFRELNVPNAYYDEVNVGGMRIVAEAAVRAKVRRLIYCSTCGVHGNVDHPPADETAPIQPAIRHNPRIRRLAAIDKKASPRTRLGDTLIPFDDHSL